MATKKDIRRYKIRKRIRRKLHGTSERPRLSVFRSNKEVYVQLINDDNGTTLVAADSGEFTTGSKVERSFEAGKKVANVAKEAGIEVVTFDRGGYLYHGRIKALADGARDGGLKF